MKPFFLLHDLKTEVEEITRKRLYVKQQGPFGSSFSGEYISLAKTCINGSLVEMDINEEEPLFLLEVIHRGYDTPLQLAVEVADLALEGRIPESVNHDRLRVWLDWFCKDLTWS